MNEALLTVKDVEKFILKSMKRDRILDRTDLLSYLGICDQTLKKFIDMGMPWFKNKGRKKFILTDVQEWLIDNGIELKKIV